MPESISISVFEIVGTHLCVASDDGQKVCDRLAAALKKDHKVLLSFRNISTLTPAFLNTAIGQLYGEFEEDHIKSSLTVEDMEPDDLVLLEHVVETAKLFFNDPERFKKAEAEQEYENNAT